MHDRESNTASPRPIRVVRRIAVTAVAALVVGVVVKSILLLPVRVESPSMSPTIQCGDIAVIDRVTLRFRPPRRYEVIAFHHRLRGANTIFLKRVVALTGERVEVVRGKVVINGKLAIGDPAGSARDDSSSPTTSVRTRSVFVMGDNRRESIDSRTFGAVDMSSIIGRVWFAGPPSRNLTPTRIGPSQRDRSRCRSPEGN